MKVISSHLTPLSANERHQKLAFVAQRINANFHYYCCVLNTTTQSLKWDLFQVVKEIYALSA